MALEFMVNTVITWTNVKLSSLGFCGIQPAAILQQSVKISIHKISLKLHF